MEPALPVLDALAGTLRVNASTLHLELPPRVFRRQALIALGLAPLGGLAFGLLIALQIGDLAHAGPILAGVACGVGGLLSLVGLGQLLLAGRRAARSGSVIDLTAGTVTPAGGRAVPLSALRSLRLGQPNRLLKFVGLIADGPDGVVILLGGVPPRAGGELAAIGAYVGERLGQPVEAPAWIRGRDRLGMDDTTAALFCWMPVQGLFLFFSVWYWVNGKERPYVAFHARQSLAQFAVSLLVLAFTLAVGVGSYFGIRTLHGPEVVGIVILAGGLGLFFVVVADRRDLAGQGVSPGLAVVEAG